MAIKKQATEARNSLQQGIYVVINPIVRGFIKAGFTPNMVTTVGFLGNVAAAAVLAVAGYNFNPLQPSWGMLTLAGALIIGFSLFDMLDGQVARLGNMASRFGAMYDSVLDRYCELFTLGGIAYYMLSCGYSIGALITFLALIGSIMVSYVRARGEGLGVVCKMGFMQRPERVVVTAVSLLVAGIYGQCADSPADVPVIIVIVAMSVIAVFANLTAFARLNHCRKEMQKQETEQKV